MAEVANEAKVAKAEGRSRKINMVMTVLKAILLLRKSMPKFEEERLHNCINFLAVQCKDKGVPSEWGLQKPRDTRKICWHNGISKLLQTNLDEKHLHNLSKFSFAAERFIELSVESIARMHNPFHNWHF